MTERRDFPRLVAGQGVSAVGDGVNRIAILWWARQATGSDAIVVLVALATVLPSLAAAPLAGWLVDRLPRRNLMLGADAIRCVTSAVLAWAVWAGSLSTAFVIAMAVIAAVAAAVFDPALLASVTLMVKEDELVKANSLLGGTVAIAGIAGPALGGVLVGVFGTGAALMADAATFLISFVLVALSRVPDPVRTASAAGDGAWAGFRLLRDDRSIRDLVVVAAGLNLCVAPLTVLVVGLAAGPLNLGGSGFGLLAAAVPLGILIGFVIAPKVGRSAHSALFALLVTGGFLAAAGLGPWAVWAGAAFVLAGVGVGVINSVLPARFQQGVAPEVQGRVFALVGALGQAGRPVGLLLAAPLIAVVGVRGGFVVCGVALAAVAWAGRGGLAGSAAAIAGEGAQSTEFDECLR
ncbi:MAG: MFS transporter [Actinomycetota bacterium]|nr:MFS transporter [Actinomycetota bacterium]